MVYGGFKDLTRRTASEKILPDKVFNIAKNPKYTRDKRELTLIVYKCFAIKTSGGTVKDEVVSNKELTEELHKPIIRKFRKRKAHLSFTDNIWGADLADLQLISKVNRRTRFCYALLIFSANTHGLFL